MVRKRKEWDGFLETTTPDHSTLGGWVRGDFLETTMDTRPQYIGWTDEGQLPGD